MTNSSKTSSSSLGCCVDRKYGKGCTEDTCMSLPSDATCSDCAHVNRCSAFGFSRPGDQSCSFFPRRFVDTRGGA